jgi:UDP-glucose 4-epimerase
VILDNLSNSKMSVVDRIELITGQRPRLLVGDIRDRLFLKEVFAKTQFDAVIHFAGLKSVSESERNPLDYYDNNVTGSLVLLQEMQSARVKKIVFSSSATVYGNAGSTQYSESSAINPANVYGRSKLMVEECLRDLKKSDSEWRIAILRYFNPVGAHSSGLIGEDPLGVPNNLMPFMLQVAAGARDKLFVFGADYPTPDGTGLRDYIHVDDLSRGHLDALKKMSSSQDLITVNLGTGKPYSVLEIVAAFERQSGKKIPIEITGRRDGDLAAYYADASLAYHLLGWAARYDIDRMCADSWHWLQNSKAQLTL